MLGDRYRLIIEINKKKYKLELTFQAIKNLYQSTGVSLFKWLEDFNKAKDKKVFMYQIIFSMTNAKISIDELEELFKDDKSYEKVLNGLLMSIYSDLVLECIEKEEEKETENEEMFTNETFEKWWNYMYYVATIKMNKTDKWFYKSTPRILKSLNTLRINDEKNIILGAYADILRIKNKAKNNNSEEVIELDEYTSIGSIFGL